MEFSRVGEHTIKCIITEDEILDLGFTLDEIMSNGERTQEFMNHIFDLAEQEFSMKFEMGVKTVRADFMPDHTLALTFSEHQQGTAMMEHLKDIVNGFLESIPQAKLDELKKQNKELETDSVTADKENAAIKVIAIFGFADMDTVISFSKHVEIEELPENSLYKYQNEYYLIMDLSDCTENQVLHYSILTDEYAKKVSVGEGRKAFVEEHGTLIIEIQAIQTLRKL